MPRARRDPYICPRCGTRVEKPAKTWQLIAPIPDAKGRVTITIMGSFKCPSCNYSWRSVISKVKAGAEGVEVESAKGKRELGEKKAEERRGQVIEIDLSELEEEE